MSNVRQIFADRLNADLERKCVSIDYLAKETNLSCELINRYKNAEEELKITDLEKICNVLGMNLLRIFDPKKSHQISLQYRKSTS